MDLVEKLRLLASKNGESLESLGKNSGVGEKAIYRWNRIPPNLATLKKIADYLELPLKDLIQ